MIALFPEATVMLVGAFHFPTYGIDISELARATQRNALLVTAITCMELAGH
jgi:hypothetical protein